MLLMDDDDDDDVVVTNAGNLAMGLIKAMHGNASIATMTTLRRNVMVGGDLIRTAVVGVGTHQETIHMHTYIDWSKDREMMKGNESGQNQILHLGRLQVDGTTPYGAIRTGTSTSTYGLEYTTASMYLYWR
jgi:hypothetical protein